jgi:hypothetical protein
VADRERRIRPLARQTSRTDRRHQRSDDIEVELVAPAIPGATIAFWQMVDQEGDPWYPDRYADCIWVRINVVPRD